MAKFTLVHGGKPDMLFKAKSEYGEIFEAALALSEGAWFHVEGLTMEQAEKIRSNIASTHGNKGTDKTSVRAQLAARGLKPTTRKEKRSDGYYWLWIGAVKA